MRKSVKGQKGFTLIELIMVVSILAILAAVAIPKWVDLQAEAKTASEQGVVGGVRAGILTYFIDPSRGNRTNYPATLDSASNAACSTSNPCFTTVLQQGGITSGNWSKASSTQYTGPTGTTYTYDPSTGSFS